MIINSINKPAGPWQTFIQKPAGYFSNRSKFGSTPFKGGKYLIGKERAMIMTTNVMLPFLLYRSRKNSDITAEKQLHEIYTKIPDIKGNQLTKTFLHRMIGNIKKLTVTTEQLHQGTLQIYSDFCYNTARDCTRCKFLKILDLTKEQLPK
jgi:hypothetical protein